MTAVAKIKIKNINSVSEKEYLSKQSKQYEDE